MGCWRALGGGMFSCRRPGFSRVEHCEPREHFSRLLTLYFFARVAVGDSAYGYRSIRDACVYLQAMGHTDLHAMNTLRVLYDSRCLEGRAFDAKFDDASATPQKF